VTGILVAGLATAVLLGLLRPARSLGDGSVADRAVSRVLAPGAAACLVVVLLDVVPAVAVGPVVVAVPGVLAGRALARRRAGDRVAVARADRVAEVCDLLAAELAAGRTPEAALEEAAVAWPAVRPVADACRLGGDVPTALRDLSASPGAGGLRLLGAAWAVSQRTGAGLRAGTRRVADSVRAEQETRRVVAGELASARATARLMCGLPVLALLMGSGAGGDPWPFLLGTPWGLGCLAAGLACGFAGLWWIELIACEAER
jgi:tight adherence protein B